MHLILLQLSDHLCWVRLRIKCVCKATSSGLGLVFRALQIASHSISCCRYCFSPTLVPFPSDWDRELIDIVGFFFLDNSQSEFQPDAELEAFLVETDKPVYVGFGSLIVGNVEVRPEPLKMISATVSPATAMTYLLSLPAPAIKADSIIAFKLMWQEEPC